MNVGLKSPTSSFMKKKFGGPPSSDMSVGNPKIDNHKLASLLSHMHICNDNYTGLKPALESLKQVFADVQSQHPDLYRIVWSRGMEVCRGQRGDHKAISNHAWGIAVDLRIDRLPTYYGQRLSQNGLTALAVLFNKRGWYWGGMFHKHSD